VDLELEFRNSGDKDFTFLVGGTNPDVVEMLNAPPAVANFALSSGCMGTVWHDQIGKYLIRGSFMVRRMLTGR
jgi:hypothetical protein